jgi:polysaccharide biosynthesis/export protein
MNHLPLFDSGFAGGIAVFRKGPAVLAFSLVLLAVNSGPLAWSQNVRKADPPPTPEKNESPKVPSQLAADSTGLPIDPKTYVIGAEDILNITVWKEPELSRPKGVRPDGKITLPIIGDIQAAGLTPERLAAQLKQALSQGINNPDVTVEVIQVNSKRYTVTGGVNRPGMYPLVMATRVFEALNGAGGFREFANKKDILIMRANGEILHFNYNDYLKGKKRDNNILLENGDTIVVKE